MFVTNARISYLYLLLLETKNSLRVIYVHVIKNVFLLFHCLRQHFVLFNYYANFSITFMLHIYIEIYLLEKKNLFFHSLLKKK